METTPPCMTSGSRCCMTLIWTRTTAQASGRPCRSTGAPALIAWYVFNRCNRKNFALRRVYREAQGGLYFVSLLYPFSSLYSAACVYMLHLPAAIDPQKQWCLPADAHTCQLSCDCQTCAACLAGDTSLPGFAPARHRRCWHIVFTVPPGYTHLGVSVVIRHGHTVTRHQHMAMWHGHMATWCLRMITWFLRTMSGQSSATYLMPGCILPWMS